MGVGASIKVINGVKKKNYSPENKTCVHGRRLFLPYFF